MDTQLIQRAQEYFQDHLGISLDALTEPIDAAMPAGKSLRGSGVYSVIEQARRQDDASLPMGTWEHDLKRADWDKVSSLAAGALALAISSSAASATPPPAPASPSVAGTVVPMAWAVTFFICTGMTWGKMQVDAHRMHRELTAADGFRGVGRCLFPPFGFARLMQGR